MAKTTSAGTTVSIGTTIIDPTTDTFIPIGEITDIGEFGTTFQEIKHNPISGRLTQKYKGSIDSGNMQLKLARDLSDAGQAAVQAALASDSDYNFQVELNDKVATHGTRMAFKAKVMSVTNSIGNVNSIVGGTINLSISSAVTYTAAA